MTKEEATKKLADIIFYAAKSGYMPYDTDDEMCAMNIAKEHIDEFYTSLPSDLVEAAFKYADAHCAELYKSFETHYDKDKKGLISTLTSGDVANISQFGEDAFKAGAKWDREQMMKEAVEGKIHPFDEEIWVEKDSLKGFEDGDKVHIIIIKKD